MKPTQEMIDAARNAGEALAGSQPGALVGAMGDIAVAGLTAALAAMPRPEPVERGLRHPNYAYGISDAELIKEALDFCNDELDCYEGLEYDDDSEVCCQRSNTFIRELVRRLAVSPLVSPLDPETGQKLRDALRFAASRSVMSAEDERRILSALITTPPRDDRDAEIERLKAKLAKAAEALEPLAEKHIFPEDTFSGCKPEDYEELLINDIKENGVSDYWLEPNDIRKARAALADIKAGGA